MIQPDTGVFEGTGIIPGAFFFLLGLESKGEQRSKAIYLNTSKEIVIESCASTVGILIHVFVQVYRVEIEKVVAVQINQWV